MCVKPDGSLSASATMILKVCREPVTIDKMASETGLRAFRIKGSIRELTGARLLEQDGDCYQITIIGSQLLQGQED
jgi:predicted transcriptional regulator